MIPAQQHSLPHLGENWQLCLSTARRSSVCRPHTKVFTILGSLLAYQQIYVSLIAPALLHDLFSRLCDTTGYLRCTQCFLVSGSLQQLGLHETGHVYPSDTSCLIMADLCLLQASARLRGVRANRAGYPAACVWQLHQ